MWGLQPRANRLRSYKCTRSSFSSLRRDCFLANITSVGNLKSWLEVPTAGRTLLPTKHSEALAGANCIVNLRDLGRWPKLKLAVVAKWEASTLEVAEKIVII